MQRVIRIISGGQTGVDRAALDFAVAQAIPYGGWCPRGGWAEDVPEPPGLLAQYPGLRETPDRDPRQRTEWNVRDADATLVFLAPGGSRSSPGTIFTVTCAEEQSKPLLVVDPRQFDGASREIGTWLDGFPDGSTLNIAGPRESEAPGIYQLVWWVLGLVWSRSQP